jgi:hypothetical protein
MSLKRYVQISWLAPLLIFVVYFGFENWDTLKSVLRTLDPYLLIEGLLLILIGKLALVRVMQLSCERFSIHFSFAHCFHIYNVTQMAKYLPGALWQFIGRFALIKEQGAVNRQIRDAMVYEHVWIVLVAAIAGLILTSYRYDGLLELGRLVAYGRPAWAMALAAAVALIVIGATGAVYAWTDLGRLKVWTRTMLPTPQMLLTLAVGWLAFGLAFWVTTLPVTDFPPPWFYAVGVFCLGCVAGFMFPLAPAGLGIREAVISVGMMPYLGLDHGILLAAVNRALYMTIELAVFAVALPLRRGKLATPTI